MSFGKDDSHLNNIAGFGGGTFGQQASAASARPQRRGGKMPYWRNNFELSENPVQQDTFRILRGNYRQQFLDADGNLVEEPLSFVKFREHFHGSMQKGAICSGGPYYMDREKRQLCEGCTMYWEDYMEKQAKKNRGDTSKGPNRISMMDKYGFTVWDYAYYFEMPSTDSSGQLRINQRTGQPYTEWVKAFNPQDPQFTGRQWKQGDLRPWAVGKNWFDILQSWNIRVGLCCSSCGAMNSVVSRGWYCGNPQCRQLIFDPNHTTMSAEHQAEMTKRPYHCPHCGMRSLPHEEVQCQQCGQGRRSSIFDVDFYGFTQRTGANNQKTLVITGHSEPRAIQAPAEVLEKIKPLDLLKHFAPTPVDIQRKLWNIGGQAAPPPQQQQWAPPPMAPGAYPAAPTGPVAPPQPAYAPQPYAPQPTYAQPQPADPQDINAQLAAMSQSMGGNNK